MTPSTMLAMVTRATEERGPGAAVHFAGPEYTRALATLAKQGLITVFEPGTRICGYVERYASLVRKGPGVGAYGVVYLTPTGQRRVTHVPAKNGKEAKAIAAVRMADACIATWKVARYAVPSNVWIDGSVLPLSFDEESAA